MKVTTPIERSQWLQARSSELLEYFNILPTLAKMGEVWSIGSYSYRLMQVPDIDFKIFCQPLDARAIRKLGEVMSARADVIGLRLLDFTKQPESDRPGIYLNLYPQFAGELWKLDLLFLPLERKPDAPDALTEQLQSMPAEQRDLVLRLKAELLEAGRYAQPTVFHNASLVHGVDVYRAVLAGARSVDELDELLHQPQ